MFDHLLIKTPWNPLTSLPSKARTPATPPAPGAAWPPRPPCGRRRGRPPWLRGPSAQRLFRWRCTGHRNLGKTPRSWERAMGHGGLGAPWFCQISGLVNEKSKRMQRFQEVFASCGWMLENRRVTSWQLGFAPPDAWNTHGIPSQAGSA